MSAEAPLEVFYRVRLGQCVGAICGRDGEPVPTPLKVMDLGQLPTTSGILGAQVLDQKPR